VWSVRNVFLGTSAFISRFAGGNLVQMDFEAYHLRLIGHYMNIDMPIEPIHHTVVYD